MRHTNMMATIVLVVSAAGAVGHHTNSTSSTTLTLTAFVRSEARTRPVSVLRSAAKPAAPKLRTWGPVYKVTATSYNAVAAQTDDEPFVTADNSFIKPGYSSKQHWLAISRDLLKHWGGRIKYGDRVRVRGISPELDGVYTVHDTMNKRHHHCIDILSNPHEKFDLCVKGVQLQRVEVRWPLSTPQPLLASSRARRPQGQPRTPRPDAAYLAAASW